MTTIKLKLCASCERKLAAWQRNVGERAMAGMAGQILQACPECMSKLPQTDGHLFTKLVKDFEPDFEPQKGEPR